MIVGADAQDGPLALGAQPQVAVVHQKLDAVLLGRDRVFLRLLDDCQAGHIQLEAAGDTGRALVGLDSARDDQR